MISYEDLRDKTQKERISIAAEFYERDEFSQCERVLSFILDNDPHSAGAIATLGAMYVCQDRYGMAEMVYRYGVALYPQLKSMWIGLGTSIRNPERCGECIATGAQNIINGRSGDTDTCEVILRIASSAIASLE